MTTPRRRARWSQARSIAAPIALLVGWLVAGTLGYALIEGFALFDALYMTTITLSTVGFQEVHPLSPGGRAFTLVLILGGLGSVLFALTRVGQMVVEGELLDAYGRRRRMREIERMTDHYIVCGYGRTARPVAAGLLDEGIPFCVIERDATMERELRDAGLPYVVGDATDEDVLRTAGIERAKGILALLASDADNLYLALTARTLNAKVRILARASDAKAEAKLRRAGADDVVMPYKMAGMRVIQAIARPHVLEFVELLTRKEHLALNLEEVRIQPGSELAGITLADARLRQRTGAIVVAIQRGDAGPRFNPESSERLHEGDVLLALGPADDLQKLEAMAAGR